MSDLIYDLDQEIMRAWNVVDDIELLSENILNNFRKNGDLDSVANILIGLKSLYQIRFEKVHSMYEEVVQQYNDLKRKIELSTNPHL
jgi:hypothetical protein